MLTEILHSKQVLQFPQPSPGPVKMWGSLLFSFFVFCFFFYLRRNLGPKVGLSHGALRGRHHYKQPIEAKFLLSELLEQALLKASATA